MKNIFRWKRIATRKSEEVRGRGKRRIRGREIRRMRGDRRRRPISLFPIALTATKLIFAAITLKKIARFRENL